MQWERNQRAWTKGKKCKGKNSQQSSGQPLSNKIHYLFTEVNDRCGVSLRNDKEWDTTYNTQLGLPLFGLLFLQWQWVSLLYSQSLYSLFPHTHSHTRLYPQVHTMSQRKKYGAIWLVASIIINRVEIICLTFTQSKC